MPMPSDYNISLIKAATTKYNAAYYTSVFIKNRGLLPKWVNFHPSMDK